MSDRDTIFLLTDFGHRDHYVGVMKAVIARIAPRARVIDLCHEVDPQSVISGSYLLETSLEYLPESAIVVGVIDPGVGTKRRGIATRLECGRVLVGPDNGLFAGAFDRSPPQAVHELREPRFRLQNVSSTFHGRDVFSPAAAHLSAGVSLERLGPRVDIESLAGSPLKTPYEWKGGWVASVVHVDHFGNVITDLRAPYKGVSWYAKLPGGREIHAHRTFGEVSAGDPLAYVGSGGFVELALRDGDFSRAFGLVAGEVVMVRSLR